MFQCTQTNFNASKVLLISMNQRHTISLGTKMLYVGILRKIKMLNLLISYLQVFSDISYIRVEAILFQEREHYHVQGENQCEEQGNNVTKGDKVKRNVRISNPTYRKLAKMK